MLGNYEKEIPSTSNDWPQKDLIDDQKGMMVSRVMDKAPNQEPNQHQNQNPQQALKCPRCDSSNTKFCYYNNYSLSQPRHFCKACKRYWTRGGTLRNVPVGGGCRKNKRVLIKRSSSSSSSIDAHAPTSSSPTPPTPNPNHHHLLHNHINNPLFYGLPTNPTDLMNHHHSYPSFTSRVSSHGLDLQAQLNGLGLGFDPLHKSIQNPLLSSYSLFGSSAGSYPTMASFLASSLHPQKFKEEGNGATDFHAVGSYEDDVQAQMTKKINGELKIEKGPKKQDWNMLNVSNFQNQIIEQVSSQTDPSVYWNHATSFGGDGGGGTNWLDPSLNGPSAHSLI